MFIVLISLAVLSGLGMIILLGVRFKEVRLMPENELISKLQAAKPFFLDFNHYIVEPTVNFWKTVVLPKIYKEFEKLVSRLRINILKLEGWLLKLANYIRGKRKIQTNNEQSPYWKDINDFKNDLNEKDTPP